jgi:phosphoserine phosphatase
MSPVLIAADLDRTLIYSRAAIDLDAGAWPETELVRVEYTAAGHESFISRQAAALLGELAAEHVLVPVTTRTVEQLARVTLPGPPPRYAVAANGGVLLVDGRPDTDWAATIAQALSGVAAIEQALAAVAAAVRPAALLDVRVAQGMFCYAIIERSLLTADELAEVAAWGAAAGWSTSLQGRKLYLVPQPLTKSAAVAELAARTGAALVLAAGDSLLDRDLLQYADRAVRPGHGELAAAGWSEPHVHVLTSTGITAGQDIAGWLHQQARATRSKPASSQRSRQ